LVWRDKTGEAVTVAVLLCRGPCRWSWLDVTWLGLASTQKVSSSDGIPPSFVFPAFSNDRNAATRYNAYGRHQICFPRVCAVGTEGCTNLVATLEGVQNLDIRNPGDWSMSFHIFHAHLADPQDQYQVAHDPNFLQNSQLNRPPR
jgi:hypothetical protein